MQASMIALQLADYDWQAGSGKNSPLTLRAGVRSFDVASTLNSRRFTLNVS